MNNKKILLGLLFLSTKNYLKDPILTLNNQKETMPIIATENVENNQSNGFNEDEAEESDSEAENQFILQELKYSQKELEELKVPLEERLKRIKDMKNISEKQSKEFLSELTVIPYYFEPFLNPFKMMSSMEMKNLPYQDFRNYVEMTQALRKVEEHSNLFMNYFIIRLERWASICFAKLKEQERAPYKNKLNISNDHIRFSPRLFLSEAEIELPLKQMASIEDLCMDKPVTEAIVSSTLLSKEQQEALLNINVAKIIRNNIAEQKSITQSINPTHFIESHRSKLYFDLLKSIRSLYIDFFYYNEYFKNEKIDIAKFRKFLIKTRSEESKNSENIYKNIENDLILNYLSNIALSGSVRANENLDKIITNSLKRSKKATEEEINIQSSIGSMNCNEFEALLKENRANSPEIINSLRSYVFKYLVEDINLVKKMNFDSPEFRKFKNSNKIRPIENVKIDEQMEFIKENIYKNEYILVDKNGKVKINNHYYQFIKPKIDQFNSLMGKIVLLDSQLGRAERYIALESNIALAFPEESFVLNAIEVVEGNQVGTKICGEAMRIYGGKILVNSLPAKDKIKINPNISCVKIKELKILPLSFRQYDSKHFNLECNGKYFFINGDSGSGKSLVGKTVAMVGYCGSVFGHCPFAQVEMPHKINLKEYLAIKIRNQGEIPGELSNHEANVLLMQRASRVACEHVKKYPNSLLIFISDETLAGTKAQSAISTIQKNVYFKEMQSLGEEGEGKVQCLFIEHNDKVSRDLSQGDISLNYYLRVATNKKQYIDEKSYRKFVLSRKDYPEAVELILNRKFFGREQEGVNREIKYYEIDYKNFKLKEISQDQYEKISKRSPDKVFDVSYIPLLNNLQNKDDRSGNMTYDGEDEIYVNAITRKFQREGKEYYCIIPITVEVAGDIIKYNMPKELPIYESSSLIKVPGAISFDIRDPNLSEEITKDVCLLKSSDPILGNLTQEKTDESIHRRINEYLEKNIALEEKRD